MERSWLKWAGYGQVNPVEEEWYTMGADVLRWETTEMGRLSRRDLVVSGWGRIGQERSPSTCNDSNMGSGMKGKRNIHFGPGLPQTHPRLEG